MLLLLLLVFILVFSESARGQHKGGGGLQQHHTTAVQLHVLNETKKQRCFSRPRRRVGEQTPSPPVRAYALGVHVRTRTYEM